MLTRTPKHVQTLVALPCAVMVVLAPFARQLHQVFANHRHVFSALSGQIVDAGPRQRWTLAQGWRTADDAEPTSNLAAREPGATWTPCAVSNLAVVHSLPTTDPGFLLTPRREREALSCRDSGSLAPGRILRFAPKNSPPTDLA